jgi:hypothetical protein
MKKLIITCAMLTGCTMLSFAQSATNSQSAITPQGQNHAAPMPGHAQPEQMAQRRSMVYQKQLALSDEQTKKVYNVELNYAKQNQAMRANGAQPGEGQVMQLGMARDQQLQQVMTPEQYTKYQSMQPKAGAAQNAQPASKN